MNAFESVAESVLAAIPGIERGDKLCVAARTTLENALHLLGIEALERM